jgi:hypothetical protein
MLTPSRRRMAQLRTLQGIVRELETDRNAALRIFMASRNVTTVLAQRELWLEFSWVDQEYRVAVRELARFCFTHRGAVVGELNPADGY